MQKFLSIVALAACVFSGSPASARAAEPASPSWAGVWRGAIGTSSIQVCLQHTDYQDFGAYYYMRHLQIIHLDALDKPAGKDVATWTEADASDTSGKNPQWHVAAIKNGRLYGTWTGNGKSLPITLTSVAVTADDSADQPCGSDAFSLPRFTKPVVTTTPARIDGIAYSRVVVDIGKQFPDSGFETFQLAGKTPAIRRINDELYRNVPTDAEHAEYFTCAKGALGQYGQDGQMSSTASPETLTSSFLVLSYSGEDSCGGAHPNAGTSYETWDLRKGTKIDLDTMLTAAALTRTVHNKGTANQYVETAYTAPFKAMILRAFPAPDAYCKEAVDTADSWSMRLTKTGMAFTPDLPHVVQACTDDAVVPFATLQPYLTPDGKALVTAFQAEVKARK